jgi:hypothetical protein
MPSRAGVGYSVSSDSSEAGIAAAESALAEAGTAEPQVALLFHTAKHDPRLFHAGVRSVLGANVRLLGGFTGGIITRDYLGYDGYESAVAVLASDSVRFDGFAEVGLNEHGEREVGRRLGTQIRGSRNGDGAGLIYMYDSIKSFTPEGGFDMNIGTYVMEGLTEGLGTWPAAAGVGMVGNMQLSPTYQFFDDQVVQQAALALLAQGESFRLHTTIMHGCRPSSSYHTVTKSEENLVLEIDGRPALDVIDELLGPESDTSWADYPLFVTLGVNKGDKFGPFKEEEYANRLCMAVDHDRRALVMFEPDLVPGSEVQLMRRAIDFDYIHHRAERILEEIGDREPFFAIYIDCMGRASAYCGSEGEEGAEVQKVIGSRMPLLGLYSGVELAEVMGRQQALDWTGVLCVFCE